MKTDTDIAIDRLVGREAADEMRAAVAEGEYESVEAALREAVSVWRRRRTEDVEWLRAEVQKGLGSLEAGDAHQVTPQFWEEVWAEAVRSARE